MCGYAVHHAVRARFAIERGRVLQAEYWLSPLRGYVLSLACIRCGLPSAYGRGFDALPVDIKAQAVAGLARPLEHTELLRALRAALDELIVEMRYLPHLTESLEPELRLLQDPWPSL